MKIQEKFAHNSGLIFEGGADSLIANTWISDMEYQFDSACISHPYLMARVAPTMFQKEVVACWKGQKALMDNITLDWEEFKNISLGKYFSAMDRELMREKFAKIE